MANITRIKSTGNGKPKDESSDEPKVIRETVKTKTPKTKTDKSDKKAAKKEARAAKRAAAAEKNAGRKGWRKVLWFIYTGRFITAPIMAFAYYVRDSWREILLVRWPDRKMTWKFTLSVIAYTIMIGLLIAGLDVFFSWLFNTLIG